MYQLIKEREIAKYSGLDDISFLSFENVEIIADLEKIPDLNDLFNKYGLIDYEELSELVFENGKIEVDTYTLIIDDTYNVVGYKMI